MEIDEVKALARQEFAKHGLLAKTRFCIDDYCHRRLGQFRPPRAIYGETMPTVAVSRLHIRHNNLAEVLDTLRHEIAHCLDYFERGYSAHDANWQKWCHRVGCLPTACSRTAKVSRCDDITDLL